MLPPTYHRPIIPLLLAFMAGILIGRFFPGGGVLTGLIGVAALIRLFRSLWQKRPAAVAPLVLIGALGHLAVSPFIFPVFPPSTARPYIDENPCRLSGIIVDPPLKEAFRIKCRLGDLEILPDEHRVDEPVRPPGYILLNIYGTAPSLHSGDRVFVTGGIRPLKNFNNPGGFDYRQYMAYNAVWGSVYGSGRMIEILPAGSPGLQSYISNFRESVDLAIGSVSEGDSRAVLSALIVGKKDRISPRLQEAFSSAGASHLLAISGLHIGIVASFAFILFRWLLGRSEYLLRHARVRKWAALAALCPVIAYGLISGMSPSTQRAVLMVAVFLAAFVFERESDSANTLGAAALAILAVSPPALFNISFQLSFAAVGTILYGLYLFPWLRASGQKPLERIWKTIVAFMAISFFAIVGTMPLVMHYFNQVSVIGVVSNLVLIPLIGFLAVPVGLLSTAAHILSESLALRGFALTDLIVRAGLFFVHGAAMLPFGGFRTVTPSILEMVCFYLLLFGIPLWVKTRRARIIDQMPANWFSRGIPAVLLSAILILSCDLGYWIHRRYLHGDMRITVLDVGQGNAALLEIPGGRTLLIDGGGFSNNEIFDVGAFIVAPFLWNNKIRSIDTVLLTHPDADHMNGLLFILKHFPVGRVISTHLAAESAEYREFSDLIRIKGIPHPDFDALGASEELNDVVIDYLYPPKNRRRGGLSGNNASIVLKTTFNGISILFPGDLETVAEQELVATAGRSLSADILLSPHHGSRTSSSAALLDAVQPETVIVSARKSRYGFPSPEVLRRYNERNFEIFQTDSDGGVCIRIDKTGVAIRPTEPRSEGLSRWFR